jgi:hypothetical protein
MAGSYTPTLASLMAHIPSSVSLRGSQKLQNLSSHFTVWYSQLLSTSNVLITAGQLCSCPMVPEDQVRLNNQRESWIHSQSSYEDQTGHPLGQGQEFGLRTSYRPTRPSLTSSMILRRLTSTFLHNIFFYMITKAIIAIATKIR